MKARTIRWTLLAAALAAAISEYEPTRRIPRSAGPASGGAATQSRPPVPLTGFIPNDGRFADGVRFAVRGQDGGFAFLDDGFALALAGRREGSVLRWSLAGARAVKPRAEGQASSPVHYLHGRDPQKWSHVTSASAALLYDGVYPGVDLRFDALPHGVRYTFVLASGASPDAIRMNYEGGSPQVSDSSLRVPADAGEARESGLFAHQDGEPVECRYRAHDDGTVGFEVGAYDPSRELVIDPVIEYGTYLGSPATAGGSGDQDGATGIALDAAGNIYVCGTTNSDFPVTPGAYSTWHPGGLDAFVAKFSSDGTQVLYATFLGGSATDEAAAIAVDASGRAVVAVRGATGLVAKLSPDGSSLEWSVPVGGIVQDLAMDALGNAYVCGSVTGAFATTQGAFQTASAGESDAFLVKLDPDGNTAFATLLGGSGGDYATAVAVDGAGNAVVAGYTWSTNFPVTMGSSYSVDAFVTVLNPNGASLLWSRYLGGYDPDYAADVALDAAGNVFVTGRTHSYNFPVTAGAYDTSFAGSWYYSDGYVVKMNAAGTIVYGTYLGYWDPDSLTEIAVDGAGRAWVAGRIGWWSHYVFRFNAAGSALESSLWLGGSPSALVIEPAGTVLVGSAGWVVSGNGLDAVVWRLDAAGTSIVMTASIGGTYSPDYGYAVAVDATGRATVAGMTLAANFPVTPGAFQTAKAAADEIFVARLTPDGGALEHSTYLGGDGWDRPYAIAVDGNGESVIVGWTTSTDFPGTTQPIQGYSDAFVVRLAADGASLVHSTYLGGAYDESATDLALGASGEIVVVGTTGSEDFPVTPGAFKSSTSWGYDAFVVRMNGTAIVSSTLLGGSGGEYDPSVALDGDGNAIVAGTTDALDFPTTYGSIQWQVSGVYDSYTRGFVSKVNPAGTALLWSTFIQGPYETWVTSVAVDAAGNACVAGHCYDWYGGNVPITAGAFQGVRKGAYEVFVMKIDAGGRELLGSTYLGGTGDEWLEGSGAVALDAEGRIHLVGTTLSPDFPVTGGALGGTGDAFVTVLDPELKKLVSSEYLGGSGDESGRAVALDPAGHIFVTGDTASTDFPATAGAFQPVGGAEAYVVRYAPAVETPPSGTPSRGGGGGCGMVGLEAILLLAVLRYILRK